MAAAYIPLRLEDSLETARVPDGNQEQSKTSGPIIQFTSAIYIVKAKDEKEIICDIMRIGPMTGSVSFSYATQESSAIAGRQFEATSGKLEMGPGEPSATITVPIHNDPRWNPTTEFTVTLSDPRGCTLGLYLKVARVKVIDAGTFPADKFEQQVAQDDGVEKIGKFSLFASFISTLWHFDNIWWKTILTIIIDQLKNVYVYIKLMTAIYMVDTVFDMKNSELQDTERLTASYCVASLILGPMFVLYLGDWLKIKMDIAGHLERDLSKCVFRKFMNYNEKSREDVPTTDMVTAVAIDVRGTTDAYAKVMGMIRLAGKLCISIIFTLQQNPSAWWAVVLVPVLMIVWGLIRTNVFLDASKATGDTEGPFVGFINEMLSKLPLIADYQQRPQINERFASKAEEFRKVKIPETMVSHNNMFVPKLLGPALVALYTAIGASLVLQGQLNLGVYLATISVFGDICDAFSEMFGLVMDCISTFPGLLDITKLLNKEIDVPSWKDVNRKRRSETDKQRKEKLTTTKSTVGEQSVPASDQLEITFKDMSFAYPGQDALLQNLNLSCPQGCICSIVGQPGTARKTLMELIAHKKFPKDGMIFVPSHLRILYVAADPVLMDLSVWENLVFGNHKGNNPDRVESILTALKMDDILALCTKELAARKKEIPSGLASGEDPEEMPEQADPEQNKNQSSLASLRATQRAEIHLARAFIMNPEVLVLHRPFMHWPSTGVSESHDRFLQAFREHRDNRGFKMPPETVSQRRPRTVFFTPEDQEEGKLADQSWVMSKGKGNQMQVTETKPNQEPPAT